MNNEFKSRSPRRFKSAPEGAAGSRRPLRGRSGRLTDAAAASDAQGRQRPSLPLVRAVECWMDAARAEGRSAATLAVRRHWLGCVDWWLAQQGLTPAVVETLTPGVIRQLLAYAREANPTGRWGNTRVNSRREARPATVEGLYNTLRSFCAFCAAEEYLAALPFKNVKVAAVHSGPIHPFTAEQIQALLDAARRGRHPERDRAILIALLDTGLRVSELCSVTVGAVDQALGAVTILGKGNKPRTVYLGTAARRAIWRYLEAERSAAAPYEPLLLAQGKGAMAAAGVAAMMERLGRGAGISGVRCSPHTLRHTFAITFLRNGGNVIELQRLLGHESLEMTRRYLELAEVDLSRAHRQASPADRMGLK